MDLLGRKIIQLQGVGMRQFLGLIQQFCMQNSTNASMIEFILPLAEVTKQWGELTMEVAKKSAGNADEVGAASVDYLFYSGYVVLAYYWAKSVAVVAAKGADPAQKLPAAKFYFARILPRINSHAAAIRSGIGSLAEIA
jgi:hypothetical protein